MVNLLDQDRLRHHMDSFTSYIFRQAYEKVNRKGDRLAKIESAVNWERFRPIVKAMYRNDTERGGRPNTDPLLMVKLLVLQGRQHSPPLA